MAIYFWVLYYESLSLTQKNLNHISKNDSASLNTLEFKKMYKRDKNDYFNSILLAIRLMIKLNEVTQSYNDLN